MSDKIDREIEEILNRLDEPGPEEDMPERDGNQRLGILHRLAHISRRRIILASLAVGAFVGAGLFFGLVYPSLGSAGSDDGETWHESVGDQIAEGHHIDEAWPHGSVGEGADSDEHHREGGEQH